MKYIKIVPGMKFSQASRDKREISAVLELGYDVIIFSSDEEAPNGFSNCTFINDGLNNSFKAFKLKMVRWKYIFSNWKKLVKMVSDTPADFISGHDIFAMCIAYFSIIGKKNKPILIYDSHELEMGRNSNRNKFERFCIFVLERFISKKSDLIIIPCEEASKILEQKYKLKNSPLVIRSTPEMWNFSNADALDARNHIRRKLGIPSNAFVISYHGIVVKDRGIEKMLLAISRNSNVYGIILGDIPKSDYGLEIKSICTELGINDRVTFYNAVPFDVLWKYLVSADIGFVMIRPASLSYYLALPNKFFENIQALNPIIASDLPELRKHIRRYDVGLLVDYEDDKGIDAAIEIMKNDRHAYGSFKNNLYKAKHELSWEVEKKSFKEAIIALENKLNSRGKNGENIINNR